MHCVQQSSVDAYPLHLSKKQNSTVWLGFCSSIFVEQKKMYGEIEREKNVEIIHSVGNFLHSPRNRANEQMCAWQIV